MANTQQTKKRNISTIWNMPIKWNVSLIMTVTNLVLVLAGVIFVVAVSLSGLNGRVWYKILVVALIVGYSVMYNIAALYNVKAFENMTKRQGKTYLLYMLFDVIALCFLAMFVVNAGNFDEPFHYVSLGVFLILTIPRHLLYHQATDELKESYGTGRHKRTAEQARKSGYQTMTAMGVIRTDAVRERRPGKKQEQFAEPVLRKDRFVNMKMEGYVGGRSVDEKDNVSSKLK